MYRYPFLTSEIFGADITPLLNTFFTNKNAHSSRNSQNNAALEGFNTDRSDGKHGLANKSGFHDTSRVSGGEDEGNKSNREQSERKFRGSEVENGDSATATENIQSQSLLDYLFKFVETDEELNSVLCGYFNKLVNLLMKRNSKKVSVTVDQVEYRYVVS